MGGGTNNFKEGFKRQNWPDMVNKYLKKTIFEFGSMVLSLHYVLQIKKKKSIFSIFSAYHMEYFEIFCAHEFAL